MSVTAFLAEIHAGVGLRGFGASIKEACLIQQNRQRVEEFLPGTVDLLLLVFVMFEFPGEFTRKGLAWRWVIHIKPEDDGGFKLGLDPFFVRELSIQQYYLFLQDLQAMGRSFHATIPSFSQLWHNLGPCGNGIMVFLKINDFRHVFKIIILELRVELVAVG